MTLTEKEDALLTLLRREMNGAVSESMARGGIVYKLNYGVSLPTIKDIALRFAPDHNLAKHLYGSHIRELRIAALYIADTSEVAAQEVDFWRAGADNNELRDLVQFILLRKIS